MRKLFEKYSEMSVMAKAALWYFVATLLQKAISFITTPIYTRLLTTEQFGQYNVYYAWFDTLNIFITFALASTVYQRTVVKNESKENEITSSMLGLAVFTTFSTFIVFTLFKRIASGNVEINNSFAVAIWITAFANVTFEFWAQEQKINYRYSIMVRVTIIMSLAKPIASILAIKSTDIYKVEARIYAPLILDVLLAVVLCIYIFRKGKIFYDKKIWKSSMLYVIPLIPHYLSQRILSQSDRIMISNLVGDSEAGIYSLAYSIGMLVLMFSSALDSTMSPWVMRKIRDREFNSIKRLVSELTPVYAIGIIIVILFVPEIVKIMGTEEYVDAIICVPPIALSAYMIFLYIQFVYFEYFIGRTIFITFATICAAIFNVVLNLILIPIFGYAAAAYTTLTCYTLYVFFHFGMMQYLMKNEYKEKSPYKIGWLLIVVFAPMIIGICSSGLYSSGFPRYMVILIAIIILLYKSKNVFRLMRKKNE